MSEDRAKYLPTPVELTTRPVYAANRLNDDEQVKLQDIRDAAYYRSRCEILEALVKCLEDELRRSR